MIPKIIHYCWLSDEPWDDARQARIDNWKKILKGYEFRRWDLNSIPPRTSRDYRKMIGNKNFALASDFLQLYALHHHGGIYLDLDVEVLEPFTSVLHDPAFIGLEDNDKKFLGCHFMGAEPGHPFIAKCLSHYKTSLKPDSKYSLSHILTEIAEKFFGYEMPYRGARVFRNGLTVYRTDYFSSLSYNRRTERYTPAKPVSSAPRNYNAQNLLTGWSAVGNDLSLGIKRIHWLSIGVVVWKPMFWRLLGWWD